MREWTAQVYLTAQAPISKTAGLIILHASELDDRTFIWGESTVSGADPGDAFTWIKGSRVANHAFSAPRDDLIDSLAGIVPGAELGDLAHRTVVWLPTRDGDPVPSSGMIDRPAASEDLPRMAPWSVPGVSLPPGKAADMLGAIAQRGAPGGAVIGADLAYWVDASRFAFSLVARQRFLPGLATGRENRAVWRPVFLGDDAGRLNRMIRRMPGAARAATSTETRSPPARPPAETLVGMITRMADRLVRAATHESLAPDRRRRRRFDSIHDSWAAALGRVDGTIRDHAREIPQLAASIAEWQRPVTASADFGFRLCFRLEEPGEGDPSGSWYVRYLLQPHDDPSLLVPAEDVWDGAAGASELERRGSNLREFLLLSLGQASGVCPGIFAGSDDASPAGHATDEAGAYEFLTREATSLQQAGYGIILPRWWTGKGTRSKVAARARVRDMQGGGGRLTLDTVVRFDWEVALGGQPLSGDELERLAGLKTPLVRIRGQWVAVNASDIQSAIDFMRRQSGRVRVGQVIRMALGAGDVPGGLEFGGIDAEGRIAGVLDALEDKAGMEEVPAPDGFAGVLRPYQLRGYSWLSFLQRWGLGGCLADDMGLGKTVQLLALVCRDSGAHDGGPVLLVCPTSVIGNWKKEAARFAPGVSVMVHHGPKRLKKAAFRREAAKHDMVVSSYGLVARDIESLRSMRWRGVVLDEAQNIKNPDTNQAWAVRSLEAGYRFTLTGTPVENNVGDLWSIMEFLNPGFLGTRADFKRNFFVPIQAGRDRDAAERLRRATGPFILRRLKTDRSIISDLPDKMEMKVYCTLTREQATLYRAVLREAEEAYEADGIKRRGLILAILSKLKQVCNHPAQFTGDDLTAGARSGKLDRLTEMLEEVVQSGDRALVFTQFAQMGRILQRHLQAALGREVLFLHGRVPKGRRDAMVERFQGGQDGPRVFILSLKAGGTGLNLTAANHVFHFDRWWNPAVEDQATDRAFRIGQARQVQVHKFLCAGTLEEKIDGMIERKRETAEKVVGAGEGWITELSNGDLREVLALSKEAAGMAV